MNSKRLSFLFIIFFILINTSQHIYAKQYPDVDSSTSHYKEIDYITDLNYASGYTDGTYKPYREITRAEFTKILINAKYTSNEIESCTNQFNITFPDVSPDYHFRKYICIAEKEGIVKGYTDGYYRPEQSITFGEASKIVLRTLSQTFSLPSDALLTEYIELLDYTNSIPTTISSRTTGKMTDVNLNRSEMAYLIYRGKELYDDMFYFNLYENQSHSYVDHNNKLVVSIANTGHIKNTDININSMDLDCSDDRIEVTLTITEGSNKQQIHLDKSCSTIYSKTVSYKDYYSLELLEFNNAPAAILKVSIF
ncbi:hypothetical protein GF362_00450 [Candidatus Dojkabacteria bacterium]|nr:hypothetical protein [Candidatus Dojkabacteria bacterium]